MQPAQLGGRLPRPRALAGCVAGTGSPPAHLSSAVSAAIKASSVWWGCSIWCAAAALAGTSAAPGMSAPASRLTALGAQVACSEGLMAASLGVLRGVEGRGVGLWVSGCVGRQQGTSHPQAHDGRARAPVPAVISALHRGLRSPRTLHCQLHNLRDRIQAARRQSRWVCVEDAAQHAGCRPTPPSKLGRAPERS